MCTHKALLKLKEHVDLKRQCGYITMLNSHTRHRRRASDSAEWRGKSAHRVSFGGLSTLTGSGHLSFKETLI